MLINICSNLFDVSILNVFVMYSFWVLILNYLYNIFELNELKNINYNVEFNVMKENLLLYFFDIVLMIYYFFYEFKKYRYMNKYYYDIYWNF